MFSFSGRFSRHGACSTLRVLRLVPLALGLGLFGICRPVSAQAADSWRDPTDYLAPVTHPIGSTGVKAAPQHGEPDAPSVKPGRTWYGPQLLISDAVTLGLLGSGIGLALSSAGERSEDVARGLIWGGSLGYALVPATIHVLHQRPAIALASASLRVALPGVGLIYGALIDCPPTPDQRGGKCEQGPWPFIGLSAGILAASLLDAGLFAYDRPTTERKPLAQFGLAPYVSQDGKRGELRAFGTF